MARRRSTRSRSNDSSDPGDAALEVHQHIYQLKKDRDESSRAVSEKYGAALAEIQARASAWLEDLQRRRTQRMLQCLTEIIDLTERREAIEVKMADVVAKADARVEELEAMTMAGYAGREKDAAIALEKVAAHQHGS
ncbi:hypothetical protein CI102_3304 [Trichoderma harzianum]|uniref:Uncharacterized protein n=1 Tax=Trichoderma harzianum CBS 226.95 TaxID=983964 RepID=A0A2T4AH96_TRIHA|nr:hypothetical protein M431DRAFT_518160 [Trichoderma harzianum CBS 226.95]PKK51352.1 hypothetical protein CI102_3304 [Trichoderma harzianum]PTB56403.1 hypothetical protein M431DRAFT_518160 [Trichoderma harzianum CBS 226.95]